MGLLLTIWVTFTVAAVAIVYVWMEARLETEVRAAYERGKEQGWLDREQWEDREYWT